MWEGRIYACEEDCIFLRGEKVSLVVGLWTRITVILVIIIIVLADFYFCLVLKLDSNLALLFIGVYFYRRKKSQWALLHENINIPGRVNR